MPSSQCMIPKSSSKGLLSITFPITVAREMSSSSGRLIPRLIDNEPCGSASISKTFLPALWSPTPRFNAVVDLPVPPFWFSIAITLQFTIFTSYISSPLKIRLCTVCKVERKKYHCRHLDRRNAYRHKKRPQILYICIKEITVLNI